MQKLTLELYETGNRISRYQINQQAFDQLADEVAKELGWKVNRDRANLSDRYRWITDGFYNIVLDLSPFANQKEAEKPKLHISGCFWHPTDREYLWNYVSRDLEKKGQAEINVTATRGVKVITAEIQRRLLDLYKAQFDSAIASYNRYQEAEAKQANISQEIATLLGTTPFKHSPACCSAFLKDQRGYVDVQTNYETVTLKISSLPAEKAKALIAWLNQ